MSHGRSARTARRRTGSSLLGVLVVLVAFTGVLGCRSLTTWSSGAAPDVTWPWAHGSADGLPAHAPAGSRRHLLGVADGEVPDHVTAFDDTYPAVANLDPALLDALRRASTDAASDGVELDVNSGWRSRAYQEQLLDEAVAKYGSRAAAARWVATPATSPHVSGDAVDIGETDARAWLAAHGAAYGLCEIYANEPWHYELRPDAADHGCPPMYADPTHDPRMHR